jgi:hypothetical protein
MEKELVYGPFLEIWKPVKGYEGLYEISSYGRVKSLSRFVYQNNGKYLIKEKIMKFSKKGTRKNYLGLVLNGNNLKKDYMVHQLVAQYIPNPRNLKYINHKDGNGFNNFYLNLEWVTQRENVCHGQDKSKTSSKYIGVYWGKIQRKWKVNIRINNKKKHLGSFDSEEEAYQARCDFEKENNIINKYL